MCDSQFIGSPGTLTWGGKLVDLSRCNNYWDSTKHAQTNHGLPAISRSQRFAILLTPGQRSRKWPNSASDCSATSNDFRDLNVQLFVTYIVLFGTAVKARSSNFYFFIADPSLARRTFPQLNQWFLWTYLGRTTLWTAFFLAVTLSRELCETVFKYCYSLLPSLWVRTRGVTAY